MTLPLAALAAALVLLGLAAFHAALALGAPCVAYAWGGESDGPLSPRHQLGSTLISPFLVAMGLILLVRGGWVYPGLARDMTWPVWVVFLFFITQMFGALRSASAKERRRMTAVYVLGVVLTATVAFGGVSG